MRFIIWQREVIDKTRLEGRIFQHTLTPSPGNLVVESQQTTESCQLTAERAFLEAKAGKSIDCCKRTYPYAKR